MTKKGLGILLTANLVLLFLIGLLFYQREREEKKETLKNFAQGLAPSVWNFYEETPSVFLEDYIKREDHNEIFITHSDGSPFIEIKNNQLRERKFFPLEELSLPIIFMEREIATIRTTYHTKIHIPVFFALLIFLLIDLIFYLLRWLQRRNAFLEETLSELNKSQNALVNSETKLAVNNLIIGLSHEINTPLGTLLTSSSYISEKVDLNDITRDEMKQGLNLISQSLKRMQVIMNRIKLIQINEETITESKFNLREISQIVFHEHAQKNKCPHKKMTWIGPESLIVKSSLEVWRKVLNELVDNACQYGSQEEKLVIEAEIENDTLRMKFITMGSVIEEGEIPEIFNPFHSAHRKETIHIGIGLHLVNNMVEKVLKGRFFLERNDDPVVFTIEVPITA